MFSYCFRLTDGPFFHLTPTVFTIALQVVLLLLRIFVFQNVTSPQVRRKTAIETDLNLESLHYISMKRLCVSRLEKKKKEKKRKKEEKKKPSGDQDHLSVKRRHNKAYPQSYVNKWL